MPSALLCGYGNSKIDLGGTLLLDGFASFTDRLACPGSKLMGLDLLFAL